MKKRAKLRKQIRMYNKRLIKRYPWLRPNADWYTGKILKDYDYEWTWYDDIPRGWRIAFGRIFLDELNEVIQRCGLKHYGVDQAKEKYGGLRWYSHGGNEETDKIEMKYGYISENVCAHCGAVDVYMTNAGWYLPLCKNCFEKNVNTTRTYEDVIDLDEDPTITNSYIVTRYSNGEQTQTTYDISDTVKKVRERYEKRIQKRRSRQ